MIRLSFLLFLGLISFTNCSLFEEDSPDTNSEPLLQFQFKFDENQERLNNIGQVASIPAGNAAQTPNFHNLSVHVIDLTPNRFTPYGDGYIAYKGAETTTGGDNAIDFDQAIIEDENVVFKEISLKDVTPGTYEYVRVSVAYQSYDVKYNIRNVPVVGDLTNETGTIASFLGFNNYISTIKVKNENLEVNDDKKQGFWAFETNFGTPFQEYNQLLSGESPAGATTVVNPLSGDSDIPPGSCVVTGKFEEPLVITGEETGNVLITLSFSINNSLEWEDLDGNGELDFYSNDPLQSDRIVDMGLRGLEAKWNQ